MDHEMTITQAARLLGIPYYRIQYLERIGRIPKARRNCSGHRVYGPEDIEIIQEQLTNTNSEIIFGGKNGNVTTPG